LVFQCYKAQSYNTLPANIRAAFYVKGGFAMPMVATKKPYTLFIKDDTDIDSPRETDDCFGKMICFHRRYNLGDKHDFDEPRDFMQKLL
jgi:hypothetical protein